MKRKFFFVLFYVSIIHIAVLYITIDKSKSDPKKRVIISLKQKIIIEKKIPTIRKANPSLTSLDSPKKKNIPKKKIIFKKKTSTNLDLPKKKNISKEKITEKMTSTKSLDSLPKKKVTLEEMTKIVKDKKSSLDPIDDLKKSSIKNLDLPKKVDPKIKETYIMKIIALIKKNKKYPRKARRLRKEGKVIIKVTILKDGKISTVNILKKSKHKILNKATLDTIKKIKRFPKIPDELKKDKIDIKIPILYRLH